MPDGITVSNSSCLIALDGVGSLRILERLYGTIIWLNYLKPVSLGLVYSPNTGHLALTLSLPEDICERVRRTAKGMNQQLEMALISIIRAATPSLEKVPPEYRAQLEAMEDLGDEELSKILRSRPGSAF